jgi:hypothetical protein
VNSLSPHTGAFEGKHNAKLTAQFTLFYAVWHSLVQMLEVYAEKIFNSSFKESSIRCLAAVTTAVYQRGIHSVGKP